MSKAPEPICERLTRKAQVLPAQGGGSVSIDATGKATAITSYITDDGKRLVNPDGPEATELIKGLAFALRELVAIVRGECPSLLDEDSGGSAALDIKIDKLLSRAGADR